LAGTWLALVAGFGGLRDNEGTVTFAPRLPSAITGLTFTVSVRGCRIRVQVGPATVSYALLEGESFETAHHGDPVTVKRGEPTVLPVPAFAPPAKRPAQPPGREPVRVDIGRDQEAETMTVAPETGHTRQ
jgi:alpha,alpha-trehalose phosphorylase